MAPDLNSLPPSTPSSTPAQNQSSQSHTIASGAMAATPPPPINTADAVRSGSPTGSPRSASISLQAAATMNAGLQHEPRNRRDSNSSGSRARASPQASRRRSAVLMNIHLNDPSLPGPGEMVADLSSPHSLSESPLLLASRSDHPHPHNNNNHHHHRAPSLGELHQELEAESESQVNRLLQQIRQQQLQIQQLQSQSQPQGGADASTPSVTPVGVNSGAATAGVSPGSGAPVAGAHAGGHSTSAAARRPSRTSSSRGASPRLRSTSISVESGDWALSGRDESAFYQAETQMVVRENQMLRLRIRELEKQISDIAASPRQSVSVHEPTQHSHLVQSESVAEDDAVLPSPMMPTQANTLQAASATETPREG